MEFDLNPIYLGAKENSIYSNPLGKYNLLASTFKNNNRNPYIYFLWNSNSQIVGFVYLNFSNKIKQIAVSFPNSTPIIIDNPIIGGAAFYFSNNGIEPITVGSGGIPIYYNSTDTYGNVITNSAVITPPAINSTTPAQLPNKTPSISISPSSGNITTEFTISGSAYNNTDTLEVYINGVYWDSYTGSFNIKYATTEPQILNAKVVDITANTQNSASATIYNNNTQPYIKNYNVVYGEMLEIGTQAYNLTDNVGIYIQGNQFVSTTLLVSGNGQAKYIFDYENNYVLQTGVYNIYAKDFTNNQISSTFTITVTSEPETPNSPPALIYNQTSNSLTAVAYTGDTVAIYSGSNLITSGTTNITYTIPQLSQQTNYYAYDITNGLTGNSINIMPSNPILINIIANSRLNKATKSILANLILELFSNSYSNFTNTEQFYNYSIDLISNSKINKTNTQRLYNYLINTISNSKGNKTNTQRLLNYLTNLISNSKGNKANQTMFIIYPINIISNSDSNKTNTQQFYNYYIGLVSNSKSNKTNTEQFYNYLINEISNSNNNISKSTTPSIVLINISLPLFANSEGNRTNTEQFYNYLTNLITNSNNNTSITIAPSIVKININDLIYSNTYNNESTLTNPSNQIILVDINLNEYSNSKTNNSITTTPTAPSITQTIVATLTITNSQSVAAGGPLGFQQLISLTLSSYPSLQYTGSYANFAFYQSGYAAPRPAWIESNNNGTLRIWLNLESIPANASTTVNIILTTENSLSNSGYYLGEAPSLGPTYGQYDTGALVFDFYDNFYGTSLNTSLWTSSTSGAGSITVNNGIEIFGGDSSSTDYAYIQGNSNALGPFANLSNIVVESLINIYGNGAGAVRIRPMEYTSSHTKIPGVSLSDYGIFGYGAEDTYPQYYFGGFTNVYPPISSSPTIYNILDSWTFPSSGNLTWAEYNYPALTEIDSFSTSFTNGADFPLCYMTDYDAYTSSYLYMQWVRIRAYPPNGVMPTVTWS
ncbi:MAG: hypothetical protein QW478_09755 [Candidatus Micrarchaeaceae archaeon]